MIRRIAIAILAVALPGMAGLLLLSRRPEIGLIGRPVPESFSAGSIAQGETLAAAGHCASCHTRPGGQPFAGGYGVNTPFGIVYGTNITPDAKTGIGTWSLEAFERAMREGVARNGSHLFPAFPYYAYTKPSDDDVKALSRPPSSRSQRGLLFVDGAQIFHLFQQIRPYERSRERLDLVDRVSNMNPLVVDIAVDHQDRQPWRTDAQMLSRHMSRHGVNIGPDDQ